MSSVNYVYLVVLVSVVALMGPLPSKVDGASQYSKIFVDGYVICNVSCFAQYTPVPIPVQSPVGGAVVRIACYDQDWNYNYMSTQTRNPDGYFFIQWQNLTSFIPERCFAFIDHSPLAYCNAIISNDVPVNKVDKSFYEIGTGIVGYFSPGYGSLKYGPATDPINCS